MSRMVANREDDMTRLVRYGEEPALRGRQTREAFFKHLAELGKRDPFVFMKVILGYDWLEEYHYHWIRQYQVQRGRNSLRMYPRGTGKSTVHTMGFVLWEAVHNPKCRQLIVNAVEDKSKGFLRSIRQHIKYNTRFRMCYPFLKLAKDDQTSILFSLAEKDPRPEPSVAAIGVRGSLVSSHWDIMHLDDIVCDKDMASEEIREHTKQWYQAAQSLLDIGGYFSITGTPWHLDDLYAKLRNDNRRLPKDERVLISVKGAIDAEGELAYPSVYPRERLQVLRENMGTPLYNSQILCRPLSAETQLFSYDTAKYFDHKVNLNFYNGFYLYLDPSMGKEKKGKPTGDYSALLVGGIGPDGHLDFHRAGLVRMSPTAVCHLVMKIHKEYRLECAIVEANGFQELLADELHRTARSMGMGLTIYTVNNTTNKAMRIQSVEPLWLRGDVRLRDDIATYKDPIFGMELAYKKFFDQVVGWPVAAHDDAPDCMHGLCKGVRYLHYKESVKEQLSKVGGKGGIDAEAIVSRRYSLGN